MSGDIDRLLTRSVATGDVPGVVAIAFDRHGVAYEGAFGVRALDADDAMTVDTVFGLYSMTKPLIAAAAMRLVESGLLDVDADASEYCPALADARVLVGRDRDRSPILRPAKGVLTLRHLLTHTSGIVYGVWNGEFAEYHAGLDPIAQTALIAAKSPPVLMFDPGSRWEYGTGLEWVAEIAERVTGQPLHRLLDELLLTPLGMHETTYAPDPAMCQRMAGTHQRTPDGSVVPITLPPRPQPLRRTGGLFATMRDYVRFCRLILNDGELDGERILSSDTVDRLCSPATGGHRVTPLVTTMPEFSRDAEFFPGEPKSWSLGFQVSHTGCHTGRAPGTVMWAGLANTYFWIDRQSGCGGAVATQLFPFADEAVLSLYLEFESHVYGLSGRTP